MADDPIQQFKKDIAVYSSPDPAKTQEFLDASVPSTSTYVNTKAGTSTGRMTPGKRYAARLREQQTQTDTPPLPSGSLFDSDAFKEHTSTIGTSAVAPQQPIVLPSQDVVMPKNAVQLSPSSPITEGRGTVYETLPKDEGIQQAFVEPSQDIHDTRLQYEQEAARLRDAQFDPSGEYVITDDSGESKTVSGGAAELWAFQKSLEYGIIASELKKEEEGLLKSGTQASFDWHPETEIVKYDTGLFTRDTVTGDVRLKTVSERSQPESSPTGYNIQFPYAGAERFGTYKGILEGTVVDSNTLSINKRPTIPSTALTMQDPFNIPSTTYKLLGDEQKYWDVKVQALHSFQPLKNEGALGLAKATWNNPLTQIFAASLGGFGFGRVSGYVTGRLAGSAGGRALWNVTQIGVGSAFGGAAGVDVYKTFEEGKTGEGFGKVSMLGLQMLAGVTGFNLGRSTPLSFGKNKGLLPGEVGGRSAFFKKVNKELELGHVSSSQAESLNVAGKEMFWHLQNVRNKGYAPFQPDVDFGAVQTLQNKPLLQRFYNLFTLNRKAPKTETFGGLASDKPIIKGVSTHDWDVMTNARGLIDLHWGTSELGFSARAVADIKPMQRVGSVVDMLGGVKMQPYTTTTGRSIMLYQEQFHRLGASSLGLAHKGRVKDIPNAMRMLEKLYSDKGTMMSTEEAFHFRRYETAMKGLEEQPVIMNPMESSKIYGPSLGKKWFDFKTKALLKITSRNRLRSRFQDVYDPDRTILMKNINVRVAPQEIADELGFVGWVEQNPAPYIQKTEIGLSENIFKPGTLKTDSPQITLRHELQHMVWPRITSDTHGLYAKILGRRLMQGQTLWPLATKKGWLRTPGIEQIPNPKIDAIVQSTLSRLPTIKQSSSIPPSPSSLSTSLFFSSGIMGSVAGGSTSLIPKKSLRPSFSWKPPRNIPQYPPAFASKYPPTKQSRNIPYFPFSSSSRSSYSITPSSKVSPSSSIFGSSTTTGKPASSYMFPSSISSAGFYPMLGMHGRGRYWGDLDVYGEKKKFRKVDIANPLKNMFGGKT